MKKVTRILLTEVRRGEDCTMRVEFDGRPNYEAGERMLQAALDEVRRQKVELCIRGTFPTLPERQIQGLLT